jgi:hypothetical protein
MKRFLKAKNLSLLLGFLAMGFLLMVASGLESLTFSPGTPFSYLPEGDFSEYPPSAAFIVLMFGILVVFMSGLLFASPWGSRKIRMLLLGMLLLFGMLLLMGFVASVLQQQAPDSLPTPRPDVQVTPQEIEEDPDIPIEEGIDLAPQTFEEPPVSPWVSFFMSLGIVLIFFGIAAFFWRMRAPPVDQRTVVAEIAQQAIEQIKSGKDWGDAIVNCYAGMLQVASESHRILQRDYSLTPAEFVAIMVKARIPAAPVERLTVLFERVRYGGKQASQSEINEAIACLNDIMAVCRSEA